MELYRLIFMSPKNSEIILICPFCCRKGFLRKKHSKFHLPQKSKVIGFYDCLDYISRIYYKIFFKLLFIVNKEKNDNIPLKSYSKPWIFCKISLKKIKEFEINTIKNLIRECNVKKIRVIYSNDLINSKHLKKFIYQNDCKRNQEYKENDSAIFISRLKLNFLFSSYNFCCIKKMLRIANVNH